MIRKITPILFLLVFICIVSDANAQWVSDTTVNTAICTATNSQQFPQIIPDGNDGAIIVWQDYRNNNWDIFAQKVNANGVAQWTANGVNACVSNASQTDAVIASDDSGGVFIAWRDSRAGGTNIDLYAQRIRADGTLAFGNTGAAIATGTDGIAPTNLTMCKDGQGNAFVAWEDGRTSITPAATRPDIYMNKLGRTGVQWGPTGAAKIIATSKQINPKLVDDGAGGCILTWITEGTVPSSVRAARFNASGTQQWDVLIFKDNLAADPVDNVSIARDGSQFVFAFEVKIGSNASNGWNMFGQRIKSDGTLVWNTTASAPDISGDVYGDQMNPIVFSDDSIGSNNQMGLLVVYENNGTKKAIVMTRLLFDGSSMKPAFPYNMFNVCNFGNNGQTSPAAVKIGSGDLMIAWVDNRAGSYTSIYGQRVDRSPRRFLGPSTSVWGEAISNHANSDADQVALAPRTNGAIAVWRDNRNGTTNTDIYAQLIFKDGSLPVEVSSFDAKALSDGHVLINWETASEKDNAGFEIERRTISDDASNTFEVVASYKNDAGLRGSSFSNTARSYTHIDQVTGAGRYEYRLVDYTLDGQRTAHQPKLIEVSSATQATKWEVSQNYPNPFSQSSTISIETLEQARITIDIFDALGRKVYSPMNNILLEKGFHTATVTKPDLGITESPLFYTVTAADPETGAVIWRTPKAMTMQIAK